MTEPLNHKLDVSKIKTLTDVKNVFECMNLYSYAEEDHEKYELLKEYFTIPNEPQELVGFKLPRKSLEEISQEFDEKIDDLIERTKNNFYKSKYIAETLYQTKFNRIIENFEYAKEHGQFPQKSILTYSTPLGVNGIASTFVIKQGNKHEGYYTIGNGYLRFYMPYKPNAITRWFMNKCLSIRWVDKKND
jgi:hypothetical protein